MDKYRIATDFNRRVANPVVRWALERGIAPPGYALLETTGRKSGQLRRTPVGDGLKGDTFWIVTEHGRRAAYVRNIEANPRVRVKVGGRWRPGTAHLMPEDDTRERQRKIGRRLNAAVVRAVGTEHLTVRVDLDASWEVANLSPAAHPARGLLVAAQAPRLASPLRPRGPREERNGCCRTRWNRGPRTRRGSRRAGPD